MFFIGRDGQRNENGRGYGRLVTGRFITTIYLLMQQSLAEFFGKQVTQVTQPLYSPDLVPCDFWLFPKLKSPLISDHQ